MPVAGINDAVFGIRDVINHMRLQTRDKRRQQAEARIAAMSPRAVYESRDFLSQMNRQPIDELVRFTLRRYACDAPIRQHLTDLLVDGYVLFRNRKQDLGTDEAPEYLLGEYVPEDPHIIHRAKFVQDELKSVEVCYDYEINPAPLGPDDYEPTRTGKSKVEVWTYWAQFTRKPTGEGCTYVEMHYPKGRPNDDRMRRTGPTDLELFPYKGIQWFDKCGLIDQMKVAIFRYDAVFQIIAKENDRHSRRVKQYSGASGAQKGQEELIEENREFLPVGVKGEYPDTHPDGIQPMFQEREMLEDAIRGACGAVRLMKLHNTSGPSREMEIAPMEAQALAMRDKCREVIEIGYPDSKLHFGPLIDLSPQDLDIYVNTLREAATENAISKEAYAARLRMLLDFPDDDPEEEKQVEPVVARGITLLPVVQPKAIGREGGGK